MVFASYSIGQKQDVALYKMRRKELVRSIKERFPENESGVIILFAGFESDRKRFSQDSSFFYLSGISEPGIVLAIDLEGKTILYVPHFVQGDRLKWVGRSLDLSKDNILKSGIDEIKELGRIEKGHKVCAHSTPSEYQGLLELISRVSEEKGAIFTLCPQNGNSYCWQRLILEHINVLKPGFSDMLVDISSIVELMRRRKDLYEIEQIYKAAETTMLAHEAAAQAIMPESNEREVQSCLEYIITASGSERAFPGIVASGKSSTILHYTENNAIMKSGDLVVVDIGADCNHYCADITRTYPVSGYFTERQREVYEIVLKTQEFLSEIVKPGYWICNDEHPDKSLNHLAKEFLNEQGYGQYILHSIGHFLGLDVHDVGDVKRPLQENDVITIEPGIYIPQENIGIRIEDDFWIAKDGAICLSEGLPKKPDEVELLVQQKFADDTELSTQSNYNLVEDETDA